MPSLKEVTPVTKVPDDAHCIEETCTRGICCGRPAHRQQPRLSRA